MKSRPRVTYLVLFVATIVAGLLARRYGAMLPRFVADYAPDALWALMVFWLIGLVWVRARTERVAGSALAFAYAIEISQLYHAPGIDALRHTLPGRLILGFGFLWSDIVCYTVGVGVGVLFERVFYAKPPEH